jgi:hypothetical protein
MGVRFSDKEIKGSPAHAHIGLAIARSAQDRDDRAYSKA